MRLGKVIVYNMSELWINQLTVFNVCVRLLTYEYVQRQGGSEEEELLSRVLWR